MRDNADSHALTQLLIEIRENQRTQIEKQAEALALQKEQFDLVKLNLSKQEKVTKFADGSRKFAALILAVITLMLIINVFLLYFG